MQSSLPSSESHWNLFPNSFNFSLPPPNLMSIEISSQQWPLSANTVPSAKTDKDTVSTAVQIELENASMWNKFHQFGTEMIITKTGRRMFPTLRYQARGLQLNSTYAVYLQICPIDDVRYKFSNGKWSVNGRLDVGHDHEFNRSRFYMHPDSPATGRLWMKQPISFHRVKLTNNKGNTSNGLILLNSMHKYRAVVHIVRMHNIVANMSQIVASATFDETEFIAVTAYQNDKVTQLKIDHNPFAKGFREQQAKRHCLPSESEANEKVKIRRTDKLEPETVRCVSPKSSESVIIDAKLNPPPSFDDLSPTNSRNAPTPLATIWNPIFCHNLNQNGCNFDPSASSSVSLALTPPNPFSIYPQLTDWILPRPYPFLPMTAPPWWMCQKNFGLFM